MLEPSNSPDGGRVSARRPRRGAGSAGSAAEESADGEPVLGNELRSGDFLAFFVLRLEDLDTPALRGDEKALRADLRYLADLAFHGAERAHEMLAAVENLDFLAVQRGPGSRRRIAAADEVVREIDVARPVDLRLGGAAPALVAGLALVLDDLAVLAGHDEVRRLDHRLDAHGKEPVEIDGPQRVVGADRRLLLQDHRTLVEPVVRAEDGEPGLGIAADDRPVDRARSPVLRQQRGVVLDRALLRNVDELLRRELQDESHDADLHVQCLHFLGRFRALERRELEYLDALLLGR